METQTEQKINALIEREVKICNNTNLKTRIRKDADIRIQVLREVLKE